MVDMQAKTGPRICRPHIHGLKGFKGKRASKRSFPCLGMQGVETPCQDACSRTTDRCS